MFRRLTPAARKAAGLLLTLTSLLALSPSAAGQNSSASFAHTFVVTPGSVPAGRFSGVTLKLSDDTPLVDDAAPDIDVEVLNPSLLEITKTPTLSADKKRLLFTLHPAAEAFGPTQLRVRRGTKDGVMDDVAFVELNITEFQQTPLPPKPTPNGIKRVDAMWTLLPDRVLKDNFGEKTAKSYYGIQVVIGNNSGFDMQVVGMGFVTRLWSAGASHHSASGAAEDEDADCIEQEPADAANKDHAPRFARGCVQIPAIDHRLVRGTIEKEQAFGKRAKMLGFLTGVGTLTTGFTPYFRAANPKANFSTFTSILNGQFKEGFNLAVPDLTVRQLNRLENQVMHDELTIPNNGQERTVVFVPKGIFDSLDESGKKLKKVLMPPAEVIRRLGELILVGRPLMYFEDRQIVVAKTDRNNPPPQPSAPRGFQAQPQTTPSPAPTPNAAATPPAPTLGSVAPNSGALDDTQKVILTGTGFTPNSAVTVKFGNVPTMGNAISATKVEVIAPSQAAAGAVDVTIVTADNRTTTLAGGYTYLDKLTVAQPEPASAPAAGGMLITIRGRGLMDGARVQIGGVQAPVVSFAADHSFVTVMLPAHAPGAADIVVTNPNGKSATLAGGFTYNP